VTRHRSKPERTITVRPEQITAFRLARHHLSRASRAGIVEVCRDVAGIQAQVMSAAQQALAARVPDFTRARLQDELWEKHRLVRTSAMRQTLHLIPADEFTLYISGLRRSRVAAIRNGMNRFAVSDGEYERLLRDIVRLLDGRSLTLSEIRKGVQAGAGANVRRWMGRFWSIVRPAVVEGLVCYGRENGGDVTYVRVDQWLPKQAPADEWKARKFLLRRYLGAYGPARVQDFSHWMGASMRESKEVWEATANEMTEVRVGGAASGILRRDVKALQGAKLKGPVVRLLPGFDSYLLAHAEKDHMLQPAFYKRVYRASAHIAPVVVVDGRIAGLWTQQTKGKRLHVSVEPFAGLAKPVRELIALDAQRVAALSGLPVETTFKR